MAESEMIKKLKEYFKNTPREQVLKDWEETEKVTAGIISPTIGEFMSWQGISMAPEHQARHFIIKAKLVEPINIFISAEKYNENISYFLSC